jgi:hypothetical protein
VSAPEAWVSVCPEHPGVVHVGVADVDVSLSWMDSLRASHDLWWAGHAAAARAGASDDTVAEVLEGIARGEGP